MNSLKHREFLEQNRECHDDFMRYCSAIAFGLLDVEDLAQDVLLATYKNYDKIKNKDELLHYMVRAARNKKISFWRKNKYQTELIDLHAERLQAKQISIEKILEIQDFYKTLNKLNKDAKEALLLFELSGFSIKEIATLQGKSESAVKTKLSRTRHKLKAMLESQENCVSNVKRSLQTFLL